MNDKDSNFIDPDNPPLTPERLAGTRPAREVLGDAFVDAWNERRARYRAENEAAGCRLVSFKLQRDLSPSIVDDGRGVAERVDAALRRAMSLEPQIVRAPRGPLSTEGCDAWEEARAREHDADDEPVGHRWLTLLMQDDVFRHFLRDGEGFDERIDAALRSAMSETGTSPIVEPRGKAA